MFISSQSQILNSSGSIPIKGSGIPYSALSKTTKPEQSTGNLPTPPVAQGQFTARSSNDSSKNTQTGAYDDDNDINKPNSSSNKPNSSSNTGPATDTNIKTAKEVTDASRGMNNHGGSDFNNTSQGSQTSSQDTGSDGLTGNNAV